MKTIEYGGVDYLCFYTNVKKNLIINKIYINSVLVYNANDVDELGGTVDVLVGILYQSLKK